MNASTEACYTAVKTVLSAESALVLSDGDLNYNSVGFEPCEEARMAKSRSLCDGVAMEDDHPSYKKDLPLLPKRESLTEINYPLYDLPPDISSDTEDGPALQPAQAQSYVLYDEPPVETTSSELFGNEDRRAPPTVRPYKEHKKSFHSSSVRAHAAQTLPSHQQEGTHSSQGRKSPVAMLRRAPSSTPSLGSGLTASTTQQNTQLKLLGMGFSQIDISKALSIAGEDIDLAITILKSFKREQVTLEDELVSMGYSVEDVRKALSVAKDNKELALMILEQFAR